MIAPLTDEEWAEIRMAQNQRQTVTPDEIVRAERYFAGKCVVCGATPTVAFIDFLPDALTHCGRCVKVELSAKENDKRIRAEHVRMAEREKEKQMREFSTRRANRAVRTEQTNGEEGE